MKDLAQIDKNFQIVVPENLDDMEFHNVLESPFEVNGVFYEDGMFRRLPEAVAKEVSENVHALHARTAGGRVRFMTDSTHLAVRIKYGFLSRAPHFPLACSAGLDLFERTNGKQIHVRSYIPPRAIVDSYEAMFDLPGEGMREYVLNMPTYSEVVSLSVGVTPGAALAAPTPYSRPGPWVYYGSSITQGACASRPGNIYQNHLSRWFDVDYINLGFSGSAKGEPAIRDYIAGLDMTVFILDYDYNAPNAEHLAQTHHPFYRAVREAHPDIPILMLERPNYKMTPKRQKRLPVLRESYHQAIMSGDKNVYLLTASRLMNIAKNDGLVDLSHPNDLGFFSMASALRDCLESIL